VTNGQEFDSVVSMESIQASFDHLIKENPMDEVRKDALRVK